MSSTSFSSFQSISADESRWQSPKSYHSVWTSVANYLQPLAITALVFFLSTTSQLAYAYPQYGDLIPNHGNVPNPCILASNSSTNATNTTHTWIALGHLTSAGGGARNPFGIDFSNFGRTWSTALCKQDSDGDGRTNGEELGDPLCVWKPGSAAPNASNITHPGICEPINSTNCVAVRKAQLVSGTAPICPLADEVANSTGSLPNAITLSETSPTPVIVSTTGSTSRSSTTVPTTSTAPTTAQTTTLPRLA